MSFSGTKGWNTKPKPGVMLNPLHPLSQGLVGYWLFNEGSGSLANDISGHGNHGTLKNMSPNTQGSGWIGSEFGGRLGFDGINDYVDCGNKTILELTGELTLCSWFKFDGATELDTVIGKYEQQEDDHGYTIFIYNNNLYGRIVQSNLSTKTVSTSFTDTHSQHFASLVHSKNLLTLYLDGVSVGTPIATDGTVGVASDEDLLIGTSEHDTLSRTEPAFHGSIGPVCIYGYALSQSDVKTLYRDPFCNLLQIPIRRYSVAAPPVGVIMNQFQTVNLGADLYNGVFA